MDSHEAAHATAGVLPFAEPHLAKIKWSLPGTQKAFNKVSTQRKYKAILFKGKDTQGASGSAGR